jgi:PAS domain S-box-containing protein
MTTAELPPWHSHADNEIAFGTDRFGNTTLMSAGWTGLTGWSAQEAVGKPFADFIHTEDRPPVLESLQSLIRGEIYSCRVPARCARRDGLHSWVEIYAHPTLDEHGRIDGVRATLSDITNRRKGMQALRESEARFRAITEASPLGVYVTDAAEECIFANANFQHICGLRADALRANGYVAAVHPEDRGRLLAAREAARRSLTPYRVEHRYVHADGSQTWTRVDGAPIRDGDTFLGFVHVVEDITSPRTADEALRRSQERLQLALDGSGDTLLDWDLRSGELYLSEHWARMTGGQQGAAVTTVRDLLELIHPGERQAVQLALNETLHGERPFLRAQYRVRTRSGDWRWVETHARVMERGEDGKPLRVTGTCADITDRKNFEARQAEFMATVSHELRTPLSSVMGSLEILREEFYEQLPVQARRFIDMGLRNGSQLASLINSVLDLERIETGVHGFEFTATRASDLLTRALEANQTYAMRLSVALHVEPPPSEVFVWTDPVRAQQILTNLISNAVKFSSEGEDVALGCESQSDRVRLYVADHGSGIPEDARERIFQRFGQACNQEHSRVPGSGLGLSICKALATRLGGDIGFRSEAGKGSVFWVDLPRAKGAAVTA